MMRTSDGLSRCSGEEQSGMEVKCFDEGQLPNLGAAENDNEGNDEDVELEGIDVSKCDQHYRLWLLPEEH